MVTLMLKLKQNQKVYSNPFKSEIVTQRNKAFFNSSPV